MWDVPNICNKLQQQRARAEGNKQETKEQRAVLAEGLQKQRGRSPMMRAVMMVCYDRGDDDVREDESGDCHTR